MLPLQLATGMEQVDTFVVFIRPLRLKLSVDIMMPPVCVCVCVCAFFFPCGLFLWLMLLPEVVEDSLVSLLRAPYGAGLWHDEVMPTLGLPGLSRPLTCADLHACLPCQSARVRAHIPRLCIDP